MVYINNREHDNPHELPSEDSEGSTNIDNTVYTHVNSENNTSEDIQKLEYIYEHFQDCEKVHELDPDTVEKASNNTIYPHINNNIEYGLFENVIDSYYLDSQIQDGFTCNKTCYTSTDSNNTTQPTISCTHAYDHISQQLDSLVDTEQQQQIYTSEEDASLFTSDVTST